MYTPTSNDGTQRRDADSEPADGEPPATAGDADGASTGRVRAGRSRRDLLRAAGGAALVAALPAVHGRNVPATSAASAGGLAEGPTVYVGSSGTEDEDNEDAALVAVDAATGEQQWVFTDPEESVHSSPTVVGGSVYVGTFEGYVHGVDAATGEEEWQFGNPNGPPYSEVFSSPTVVDGTLYVGSLDGAVYAVGADEGGGAPMFRPDPGHFWTSPTVVDGTMYIGNFGGQVYAVDVETGEQRWAYDPGGDLYSKSPTVTDGTVFARGQSLDDDASGIAFALDAATGEEEWYAESVPSNLVPSGPAVVDGTAYYTCTGTSCVLHAYDAATGELEWEFGESGEGSGAPTVYDDTVYVTSPTSLHAVDPDSGTGTWTFSPGQDLASSPTAYDGTVFVGASKRSTDEAVLYAIDAATGEQQWAYTAPTGSFTGSPTVVADPAAGHSVDARVNLGTLGHHHAWAGTDPPKAGTSTGTSTGTPTATDSGTATTSADRSPGTASTDASGKTGTPTRTAGGEDDGDEATSEGAPGMGALGAAAGLGGAGYLLARRRDGADQGGE
jgi:outer membrane protein assembly factor BamB